MSIIKYNSLVPFKGFVAMNFFGIILARKEFKPLSDRTVRHEKIHTAQMREMLYIPFYAWFIIEWIVKLFKYGSKSYDNISFEREAYKNEHDIGYLAKRKHCAWFRYVYTK